MSFLKNISRIFGFGKDEEIIDETALEDDDAPLSEPEQPAPASVEVSPEQVSMIFDQAVAIFNTALPDFLAKSVDPEAQKKLLYEAIDADLKKYIDALSEATQQKCRQAWGVEHDKLKAEADQLRQKAKDLEAKRSELNDKQLSTDRQKRALSDRVHDLEASVLKLEAEKEQLELENKSLVNKAKVAAVQETELEELRQALANSGEGASEYLANKQAAEKHAAEVAELNSQIEDLNKKLTEALNAAKTKDGMTVAMVDDFRKKAQQAVAQAKEADEKAQQLMQQITLSDAQIADLKKAVAEKEVELAEVNSKLESANKTLENSLSEEQAQSILNQVEAFGQVRERLDNQISTLSDKLRESQEENESLRGTIRTNLLEHAKRQQELQKQIDDLTQARIIDLSADFDDPYKPENSNKKQKKKQSSKQRQNTSPTADVDSLLQGSDWLVSTPPKGTSMRPPEDDSFGYQPPQRKKSYPSNDSQPSLFDI